MSIQNVEGNERDELQDLQERLDSKIKVGRCVPQNHKLFLRHPFLSPTAAIHP